ncbi:peptide chain release factor N(5)-glutamine methyltransferase [Marinicella sp. W31]|uniref:peptide chain release factor N(5)-glutamine methyltransferase n=1 Tax=Marinicella sp. W31 TaxID=3023713 RepID=UPI003756ECF3
MNIKALLHSTMSQHPIDVLDAQLLLVHILDKNRAWLIAHDDHVLSDNQVQQYQQLTKQRAQGVPLAYLIGYKEFWGRTFKVTRDTLIPRPETELLIEHALQLQPRTVLDMGTGTGIIAITLAKAWHDCSVTASDISNQALAVARCNAEIHKVKNIHFACSSWYTNIDGQFDLIISNPPYIAEEDSHLQALQYEPRKALTAPQSGLQDIQEIIEGASAHLNENGWLMLEHGYDQQNSVQQLFKQMEFKAVETIKDLAGWPRISMGQKRI